MGKELHNTEYQVVVDINDTLFWGREKSDKDKRREAEDIVSEIKRHVDFDGHVNVAVTPIYICEHCGWGWTEDSDTYNGGCCAEDEKNNPDTEKAR